MPTILAIDDKPDNLVVISALLGSLIPEARVITATSGQEGLQMAQDEQPDTILLDIVMPEMDGYDVCRRLKAIDQTRHIPIIMLTALATDTDYRIQGLEIGADAFLTKPIDEAALVAQVKVALRIKRAEDKLRHDRDHLAEMVSIEDKMSSLGRVAAGIAHEIRNPLSSIFIYLNLIRRSVLRAKEVAPRVFESIEENLDEINTAANRVDSVIQRVMDFSRPGQPNLHRTDINAHIKNGIKLADTTVRKMDIQLTTELADDLPNVNLDSQSFTQVLLNLIINAAEAMNDQTGNRRICVCSTRTDRTIMVTVADSGPGVPIENQEKVFDPFFTTKKSGSGIGLSICRRIISDHGGTLRLTTNDQGGASFIISLPVQDE